MKEHYFLTITLNFLAVVLLISLIAAPLYFARNFAKVAGVKSESKFLIVSQIEKFPNLVFAQQDDKYRIGFTKQGPSQTFLGVLVLNNPTSNTQSYSLDVTSGSAIPFFGEDLSNRLNQISLPAATSVPISLYSGSEASTQSQLVEFTIR